MRASNPRRHARRRHNRRRNPALGDFKSIAILGVGAAGGAIVASWESGTSYGAGATGLAVKLATAFAGRWALGKVSSEVADGFAVGVFAQIIESVYQNAMSGQSLLGDATTVPGYFSTPTFPPKGGFGALPPSNVAAPAATSRKFAGQA